MSMSGHLNTVGSYGIVDKLIIFGRKGVKAFLNHMIAIEVFDKGDHIQVQGHDQALYLSLGGEIVNHLLDRTGAVHIQRNRNEFSRDGFKEGISLLICRVLEQFLREIVAERVNHEISEMRVNLGENHISVLRYALLELLLQEATTMLVFAEGSHIALKVFQTQTSETIGFFALRLWLLLLLRTTRSVASPSERTIGLSTTVIGTGIEISIERVWREGPIESSELASIHSSWARCAIREFMSLQMVSSVVSCASSFQSFPFAQQLSFTLELFR